MDESYEYLKRLGMRKADEVISSNAASMINSIGVTILNSLHDHAMPKGIHRFVDDAYGHIWPEMKKSLMDSVMLGAGFEFREVQKAQLDQDAEPPKGILRRIAARLIYAMEPYDLTFWGVIRSPLSLCIQIAFLFPFYGVSDTLVLTLAASKYFTNFNEHGLINFIVSSKRLQFITTGLFSGRHTTARTEPTGPCRMRRAACACSGPAISCSPSHARRLMLAGSWSGAAQLRVHQALPLRHAPRGPDGTRLGALRLQLRELCARHAPHVHLRVLPLLPALRPQLGRLRDAVELRGRYATGRTGRRPHRPPAAPNRRPHRTDGRAACGRRAARIV